MPYQESVSPCISALLFFLCLSLFWEKRIMLDSLANNIFRPIPYQPSPLAEKVYFFLEGSTKVLTITNTNHTWTMCPPLRWGWSHIIPNGKK